MQEAKQKLNIAFICDPIGSNKSGVVVSTIRFAKLLKKRGHHVIFIGAKSKEDKGHGHHEEIKTYRFRSIPIPKSGGWNLALPTPKELRKIFQKEKIDIIHTVLPMSGAIMATMAARKMGIKMVAHSHSQPENLFMEMPKVIQPTLAKIWNKYLAWLYGKAEWLIYPTEMARSLLNKLARENQPSTVISNGIDLQEFKPMDIGNFFARFKIPGEGIKLLYLGRLFPEKSIDTLIKAMPKIIEKHEHTYAIMVGGGHLRAKLEKLAQELGVEKHVIFLGLVSEEDKVFALNAGDIFVLPSLAELEGMAVLEAMACGKPIIISDAEMSASRYFVEDNGFLFKAKDPADLANQALKLITNKELREKMSKASLGKIKNYDINKSVDKLEEVYYSALGIKK